MDFAKNLLKKYGWNEGEGLGKNKNGIEKPLKATLKFDTAGLGVDKAATEFNNHWWERVFNEAAENVQIKKDKNGVVCMDLKSPEDSVEITTQSYSLKKLNKAKAENGEDARYNNFIQCATLAKGGNQIENTQKIELCDIAVKSYQTPTDEELFKACGGRTAHKGARHGLTLNGKLMRLQRQEEELLEKMQRKSEPLQHTNESKICAKNDKRKKKNKCEENGPENVIDEVLPKKVKKCKKSHNSEANTKKKSKREENAINVTTNEDLVNEPFLDNPNETNLIEITIKKKKKKKVPKLK